MRFVPRPVDWAISLAILVVQVAGSPRANEHQSALPLDGLAYALLALGPIALLFRRRFPLLTLFVVLGVAALYVRDFGYGPIFLSLVVAFLTAGTLGSRWRTYPVVAVGYVLFMWIVPHTAAAA